ncbi:MAG: hypothetical protein RL112_204 [Planctomycetota bacterium]|jgi:hypothetical protein
MGKLWSRLGAFALLSTGLGSAAAQNLIDGGSLWTRTDDGAGWTGRVVSIGARGSQVFTEFEYGNDHAELISAYSAMPVLPVWERSVPLESQYTHVDSADAADVHASLRMLPQSSGSNSRVPLVSCWRSSSSTPAWTYSWPGAALQPARVGVSDDGQTIVAVATSQANLRLQVAIFGIGSGTPLWSGEIANMVGQLRGFDLAADGSAFYAATSSTGIVFDTQARVVRQMVAVPTGSDAHAISGDGSVFAYGYFNGADVWQRNASGGYSRIHQHSLAGSNYCARIDVSRDSSTIAWAFNYFDANLKVRVEAFDVATRATTMAEEVVGAGTQQNSTGDIAISSDGSRFALGLWGDQAGSVAQLRLYSRSSSTPVATHSTTGSIFDVDISGDGERVAIAAKNGHANSYSTGGSIALFAFDASDLRIAGAPRVGTSHVVHLRGPANSPVRLLRAPAPATGPSNFGSIGVLRLRRSATTMTTMPASDATGASSLSIALPGNASLVGTTQWYQGFYTSPRRLTADWAQVTILP